MTTGKIIALTRQTFVSKVMSLLFNMLSSICKTLQIENSKIQWIKIREKCKGSWLRKEIENGWITSERNKSQGTQERIDSNKKLKMGVEENQENDEENENWHKKEANKTSLVISWLRICLPMQGTWFDPWPKKIPHAEAQPSHESPLPSPRFRACAPQQEKLPQWGAATRQLEEAHAQQWRPSTAKNNK